MTLEEALALVRAGKRVRRTLWPAGQYIAESTSARGRVVNQRGDITRLDDGILSDDWEEFVEPLTDAQVLDEVAAKKAALVAELGDKTPAARKVLAAIGEVERLIRERRRDS